MSGLFDTMCWQCRGLKADPGKAYGYAGKFCHCGSELAKSRLGRQTLEEPLQPCNCTGPRPGEPVCPCQMRGVRIINGRYIKTIDLGPAPTT